MSATDLAPAVRLADVNGIRLAFELRGSGRPLIFSAPALARTVAAFLDED